jgi:hypothetical protein
MGAEELYALVDRFLPPIVVAVLAILATVSTLLLAYFRRHPRAMAIAVGTANVAGAYLWTHLSGLSVQARAMGIRVAVVMLLLSILFYNQSAQPDLLRLLRRGLASVRGRTRWKM